MGRDIDYFYERDLDRTNIKDFYNSLPSHLKSHFDRCNHTKIIWGNVLQGYRGPPHMCNNGSGDSGSLHEAGGIQEIKFWWGARKDLNAQIPVIGTIAFVVGRAVQEIQNQSEWSSLYFDSKTGECLSHDRNEAAAKLRSRAREAESKGEATSSHCSRVDDSEQSTREALFDPEEDGTLEIWDEGVILFDPYNEEDYASRLCEEGVFAFHNQEFDKAERKLNKALQIIKDRDVRAVCIIHLESARVEKRARDLNTRGDHLFEQGEYVEAQNKYQEACDISVSTVPSRRYKENLKKAEVEVDAMSLNSEGDGLFNEGRYADALGKHEEAYNKSQITTKKQAYLSSTNKAQDIVDKLHKLGTLWEQAWEAESDTKSDRSEEAKELFKKVISESEENLKTFPDNAKFQQCRALAALKIEGNEVFNQGLQSEQTGVTLFQEAQELNQQEKYELASAKFKKANKYFEEALEKFKTGSKSDQRFAFCINFVQEQISEVKKSISITEKSMLSARLLKLDVNVDDGHRRSDSDYCEPDATENHNHYSEHTLIETARR